MKLLSLIATIFLISFSFGQDALGKWKTIDDDTGKEKSIVEIYKKGDKYFGKVIKIFDEAKQDATCTLCDDDRKNQPVMGMNIIRDMEFDEDDNEFDDGTILDPNNGKVYDCSFWVNKDGTLSVRGYVAFFFRTQTWIRVK